MNTTDDGDSQLDAHATTGDSPPDRQRANFRRDHPEAYNRWRSNRKHAEGDILEYGHTNKSRRSQERLTEDDAEYIKRVESGEWPMKRAQALKAWPYGGRHPEYDERNYVEAPVDPVEYDGSEANTREGRQSMLSAKTSCRNRRVPPEAFPLRERPLSDASRIDGRWHPGDEPTWKEAADARMDVEAVVRQQLEAAFALRRRDQYVALDEVLDLAEDVCGPDFAEELLDEVERRLPDYRANRLAALEGYHQRGRRKAA